jgi:hypothetical protein
VNGKVHLGPYQPTCPHANGSSFGLPIDLAEDTSAHKAILDQISEASLYSRVTNIY